MSRTGTTRQDLSRRRARGRIAPRLIEGLRRFGFVLGGVVLAIWLGAWVYLSGIAGNAVVALRTQGYALSAKAGFTVNDILVEGRINSDADVLRAVLNLERGDPLFAFNPAEAKDLIERISWVKEAHVERRLPATIYIGLVERTPMALWQHKGKIRVVDNEGVTLTDSLRHNFNDLPIIVGEDAPKNAPVLLSFLAAEPEISTRIEAATWVGERRWDLKLKNGIVVKLPETDMGLALRRLATAQDEDGLMDRDVTVIDLRETTRITVATRPGAIEEYRSQLKQAGIKGDNI
ncbi:MAG: cell division protein FtsQ/DivIB [Alphaproteobacteria bacterium]|nr:cell division protein FtsQ/DivIB [Alphaproteobacteria bacterium]